MRKILFHAFLCLSIPLFADFSEEFIDYHLQIAEKEIENTDIFKLIEENVNNLKIRDISNNAKKELIALIDEGHKIDAFNMAKLIATLVHRDASDNAAEVLVKAVEQDSFITIHHMFSLIDTLAHVDASDNAAKVILSSISKGYPFGLKERHRLTEINKMASARKNVAKIRQALRSSP